MDYCTIFYIDFRLLSDAVVYTMYGFMQFKLQIAVAGEHERHISFEHKR